MGGAGCAQGRREHPLLSGMHADPARFTPRPPLPSTGSPGSFATSDASGSPRLAFQGPRLSPRPRGASPPPTRSALVHSGISKLHL